MELPRATRESKLEGLSRLPDQLYPFDRRLRYPSSQVDKHPNRPVQLHYSSPYTSRNRDQTDSPDLRDIELVLSQHHAHNSAWYIRYQYRSNQKDSPVNRHNNQLNESLDRILDTKGVHSFHNHSSWPHDHSSFDRAAHLHNQHLSHRRLASGRRLQCH